MASISAYYNRENNRLLYSSLPEVAEVGYCNRFVIIVKQNGNYNDGDYNHFVKALPEIDGYCNCFVIIV
jgi:hypothetical protein